MRVLVADGHARVRERLVALVAEIPGVHAVLEADSEARAIAHIVERCPEIIVLDLRIAESGTLALVARLRRDWPSATVVALTSEPSRGLRRACAELGVDHVFDKSKDLPSLQEVIEGAAESLLR
ncbi:MAG TPA: response regulator [Polyangiaceae bacterium]|nr:response regulator [Polyangiaceae bacterium]